MRIQILSFVMLIGVTLAADCTVSWEGTPVFEGSHQKDCSGEIVRSEEILAERNLDVNQDGLADQVVLYGNDEVKVLIAIGLSSGRCEIVLNDPLTHRNLTTGRQTVAVKSIELVELTNDHSPELYIWLERYGGGGSYRESFAVHAIYLRSEDLWKRALDIEQCLAFSSFEFRDAPNGTKSIYRDEDPICGSPWSSSRNYSIYEWKSTGFERVESGKISKRVTYPPNADLVFVIPLVLLLVAALIVLVIRRSMIKPK